MHSTSNSHSPCISSGGGGGIVVELGLSRAAFSQEMWNTLCSFRLLGSWSLDATGLMTCVTSKGPSLLGRNLGVPLNFSLMLILVRNTLSRHTANSTGCLLVSAICFCLCCAACIADFAALLTAAWMSSARWEAESQLATNCDFATNCNQCSVRDCSKCIYWMAGGQSSCEKHCRIQHPPTFQSLMQFARNCVM